MLEVVAEKVGAATGSLTARKQLASKSEAERASNGLKGPMGKVNARVATLQARVATLEEELQTAVEEKAAMVAAQKALDAKPKPFPTMRAELEALKSSQSELESAKEKLQVEHWRLEVAYKNLQTKHKTMQTKENALYIEFQSVKQQHEEVCKTNSELQEKLDELKTTYEWDTKYLKMKARELSFFHTKWEDFGNADEAWLGKVPLEHLRWLEQDARKRVARIETEVEVRKLKLAGEEIEDTPAAENMKCVITQAIMQDPVSISDGHSFERTAIAKWFQDGKLVSPQTNLPVDGTATSNHALRNIIQNALEAQLKAWQQQDPPHDPIPPNTAGDSVFHPVMHDKGFTLAKPGSPRVGQKRLYSQRSVSPRPWRRSRRDGRPSASPSPEPTHSPQHSPRPGGAGRLNRWSPGVGDIAPRSETPGIGQRSATPASPRASPANPASPRASPASPQRVVLDD